MPMVWGGGQKALGKIEVVLYGPGPGRSRMPGTGPSQLLPAPSTVLIFIIVSEAAPLGLVTAPKVLNRRTNGGCCEHHLVLALLSE